MIASIICSGIRVIFWSFDLAAFVHESVFMCSCVGFFCVCVLFFFFFFFQAEDGIRDLIVTGVQTCALPISSRAHPSRWGTLGIGGALARGEGESPRRTVEYRMETLPNRLEARRSTWGL